jgi:hypothetical protein
MSQIGFLVAVFFFLNYPPDVYLQAFFTFTFFQLLSHHHIKMTRGLYIVAWYASIISIERYGLTDLYIF